MKKAFITILSLLTLHFSAIAQDEVKKIKSNLWPKGMYFQWGYNLEWYGKSDIHFKLSNGDNFTIHDAAAKDKPDFASIYKNPFDVTIPQYNIRIGFYLDHQKTKSIELNFDHTKYVMTDWQNARVTGVIDGQVIDEWRNIDPDNFVHFEHTDGANFLHVMYAQHSSLLENNRRKILTGILKAGAGINLPRTDFRYNGDKLNNKFHVAGYCVSAEAALRYYPIKNVFIEGAAKTGFINYTNAVANTTQMKGNKANHSFGYVEVIATLGFDINFVKQQ